MEDRAKLAQEFVVSEYSTWVQPFEVGDYVKNPPLIKKLYEDKNLFLARSLSLEEKVQTYTDKVHNLEKENIAHVTRAEEWKKTSNTMFWISTLANILIGLGSNIATSNPSHKLGYGLIALGVGVQFLQYKQIPKGTK